MQQFSATIFVESNKVLSMTQSPTHLDPTAESDVRTPINALLDEALAESFPASDSSAIGTGIAAIKKEDCENKTPDRSTQ